jgi:nitric oxide reductase NorD protein
MPPHEDTPLSDIELNDDHEILRLYCRALCGHDVDVRDARQLSEKNIGWSHTGLPTTDGTTIYLPLLTDKSATKAQNFDLMKVMATYQAGHIEFATFDFALQRPSTIFGDLRQRLSEVSTQNKNKDVVPAPATDMSRFFRLFPDQRLALDIFTIVESARIEASVMREYRGLARTYQKIRACALETRPDITSLPAREALVELMIRVSLGQNRELRVPSQHAPVARKIAALLRCISQPGAAVEDSAEATLRIYALVSGVVNEKIAEGRFSTLPLDVAGETVNEEAVDPAQIAQQWGEKQDRHESGYASPQKVVYRGDFMPELAQLLSQFQRDERKAAFSQSAEPLTKEQVKELLLNAAEFQQTGPDEEQDKERKAGVMLAHLMNELVRRDTRNQSQGFMQSLDDDTGPLEATRPGTFVYDEWDFYAAAYKPRWCLVQEKPIAYGDATFYRETLAQRALLAEQIRNEFELIAPEMHRKVKRLQDGEEHDLDAFIEAITDLRAGVTPSEKLFWRRNKTERSVAAAFLIDMSASTAESVDEENGSHSSMSNNPGQPSTPVPARAAWPPYKRVIDVEKEGIVLLVNALQTLGDNYGIYGFSGFGRDNVEFYVIKEIEEDFTWDVAKRIDRIAPQHATRMGAAIRHATSKLSAQEARSKFLFLISDGRPQDRGYSRDGIEKEYAVHDTRMALMEAGREGITPFCLTVDKAGHDYLKTMMHDFSYEVLNDVSLLPSRLPRLYRKLTM